MMKQTRVRARQKGSALVEFLLCVGLFWVPLLFGTVTVGFNLITAVEVTQVCRDAAHMYSQGIDFSQSTYKTLLVNLAPNLGMAATGGRGEVILSTITYIDDTDCDAAGLVGTNCTNRRQYVITRRIVVGNTGTGFPASVFGTPSASILDSSGNVMSSSGGTPYYLTNTSTRALNFQTGTGLTLASQHNAYIAETYVQSSSWTSLGTRGVAARSIF